MKAKKPAERNASFSGPGPVQKLQFLAAVAEMTDQTRADLAILITIADMINSSNGVAWPSYSTLARRSGCSARHAKLTIQRLITNRLIVLVTKGNRIRSNRYALNLQILNQETNKNPADAISNAGVMGSTMVVSPNSIGGDTDELEVVSYVSPESIHQSEHQAREKMNGSSEGEALPSGAESPSGRPQPGRDIYPEFWAAFQFRAAVAEAEQILSELIKQGVEYSEVIAGANRYAEYCKATSCYRRSSASAWLKQERWRDSWELPKSKKISEKKNSTKSEKSDLQSKKIPINPNTGKPFKTRVNPKFQEWQIKKKILWSEVQKLENSQHEHVGNKLRPNCKQCFDFYFGGKGNPCQIMKKLIDQVEIAEKNWDEHKKIRPPESIRLKPNQ